MKKISLLLALFSFKAFAGSCLITMTVKDKVGILVLPSQVSKEAETEEECFVDAQFSYRYFDRFLDDRITLKSIEATWIEVELDLDGNMIEKKVTRKVDPGYNSINDYLYPLVGGNIAGVSLQNEKKAARIEAQRHRDNLRHQ